MWQSHDRRLPLLDAPCVSHGRVAGGATPACESQLGVRPMATPVIRAPGVVGRARFPGSPKWHPGQPVAFDEPQLPEEEEAQRIEELA